MSPETENCLHCLIFSLNSVSDNITPRGIYLSAVCLFIRPKGTKSFDMKLRYIIRNLMLYIGLCQLTLIIFSLLKYLHEYWSVEVILIMFQQNNTYLVQNKTNKVITSNN